MRPFTYQWFISDMININTVLDPTIGDLLELRKILRTPEAKLWRYGALNDLARLAQGRKKRNKEVTNTIHFIFPNKKAYEQKSSLCLTFLYPIPYQRKLNSPFRIYSINTLFKIKIKFRSISLDRLLRIYRSCLHNRLKTSPIYQSNSVHPLRYPSIITTLYL